MTSYGTHKCEKCGKMKTCYEYLQDIFCKDCIKKEKKRARKFKDIWNFLAPGKKEKRAPIRNVDLTLNLRIIGQSQDSFHISTDEGDGYEFMRNDGINPNPQDYIEWADQLTYIAHVLKNKAYSVSP
jgi:hypothetical protein